MRIVRKFLSHTRQRQARKRLADDPSPMTYAALSKEHAWDGNSREALRVCEEGLRSFPGNPELQRLADKLKRSGRETRLMELKQLLREAPRPALWAEMSEILLDSDQMIRAEECAQAWLDSTGDDEAQLMLAKVCLERFIADRGRDAGLRAVEMLDKAGELCPRDSRVLHMRLRLMSKVGAIEEALQALTTLLELEPGDPELEARFRTLRSQSGNSMSMAQALREVDRTGIFFDDDVQARERGSLSQRDVRPLLQEIANESGVHAAIYLRGSTALVQGPRGATAERAARAVRRVVRSGRSTSRRLGLGQICGITLEGNFGTLALEAGEMDAGAIWCAGKLSGARRKVLSNLAGIDASTEEVKS